MAKVLWTARPPVRPLLGAEATMAEPAGPMTFRCPLAVRSTCPPARCTAATISLASYDEERPVSSGQRYAKVQLVDGFCAGGRI